jgi:hypothetical protein
LSNGATIRALYNLKAFEKGYITAKELRPHFQQLINTGYVWKMDKNYQNQADAMIIAGECRRCA